MSRFANAPNADAWAHHHAVHQDRVVLPPLSTAVDNGLTPSRRTSMASPTSYSAQGAYAFTNTFESQRAPTASSPSLSTVRMDLSGNGQQQQQQQQDMHASHVNHPYRRPSMVGRAQTAIVSRTTPTSPLVQQDMHSQAPRMTHAYSDPNTGLSWNIPPPSASGPDSARPSTATYSAYGDYAATDFATGNLATNGEGTPQSPSFAFASSGFTSTQPSGMYAAAPSHSRSNSHHGFSLAQAAAMASQQQQQQQATPPSSNASTSTTMMDQSQNHTPSPVEEELAQLRTKVRELEFVNDLVQLRVVELENERVKFMDKSSSGSSSPGGTSSSSRSTLVGSNGGSPPPSSDPDFQVSWEKRTEARVKRFCSLNRAGNALCAWHDSRRERRAYPPRMAPPGTLNCGCTYDEALFEESLSRHKVGSYLPGEMVRMDPALRNPLLALLQWRYGYKDGDFERDPDTGRWVNGEGEHVWMHKASAGSTSSSRRKQSDPDSN